MPLLRLLLLWLIDWLISWLTNVFPSLCRAQHGHKTSNFFPELWYSCSAKFKRTQSPFLSSLGRGITTNFVEDYTCPVKKTTIDCQVFVVTPSSENSEENIKRSLSYPKADIRRYFTGLKTDTTRCFICLILHITCCYTGLKTDITRRSICLKTNTTRNFTNSE